MEGTNNMSRLRPHFAHPVRVRLIWACVYIVILAGATALAYYAAEQIKTRIVPTGQIQLSVPYSQYMVGEAISFSLKNNFNSSVDVMNQCPAEPLAVYYQQNGSWIRQHDTASASDCLAEQRQVTVPANGVVNGTFAPWHHLFEKPGKYRIVAYVEYYNALPYQDIEVLPYPVIAPPPAPKPVVAPILYTAPAPTTTKKAKTITTSYGTIRVEYDTAIIYVISIAPAGGCSYQGGRNGGTVKVTFVCSENNQMLVTLSLVNDQVLVLTQVVQSQDD